jgi:hypothetical protein
MDLVIAIRNDIQNRTGDLSFVAAGGAVSKEKHTYFISFLIRQIYHVVPSRMTKAKVCFSWWVNPAVVSWSLLNKTAALWWVTIRSRPKSPNSG